MVFPHPSCFFHKLDTFYLLLKKEKYNASAWLPIELQGHIQ